MNTKRQIMIWGIFDLGSIGWYVAYRLAKGKIPFLYDVEMALDTAQVLGSDFGIIATALSLVGYVSLIFSGTLLLRNRKAGAVLAFIQTPFRLITAIPPSIFFITWPLKHIYTEPSVLAVGTLIFLILGSESLKTISVATWYRSQKSD